MKKFAVLLFLSSITFTSYSQVKLGLRFAPNISLNSIQTEGNFKNVDKSGSSVRFSAGPIADFFFADNYAFTTGLWYTVKRAAIEGTIADEQGGPISVNSKYNLQYLQIPVALKFYTNEVATDLRVYFQLGGTLDFKIAEKAKDEDQNFLYKERDGKSAFKPIDVGLLIGAGAELVMGTNTAVFGGLNYNRGLVDQMGGIKYNGRKISDDVKYTNSLISLEVGLKF